MSPTSAILGYNVRKKRNDRQEDTVESEDITLPGDTSEELTGLSAEVLALTDHSRDTDVSLTHDTIRDGVFVNLGRAYDSSPPPVARTPKENETEFNRTLQYVPPLRTEELSSVASETAVRADASRLSLPLAPSVEREAQPTRAQGPRKKKSTSIPPSTVVPTVSFRVPKKK